MGWHEYKKVYRPDFDAIQEGEWYSVSKAIYLTSTSAVYRAVKMGLLQVHTLEGGIKKFKGSDIKQWILKTRELSDTPPSNTFNKLKTKVKFKKRKYKYQKVMPEPSTLRELNGMASSNPNPCGSAKMLATSILITALISAIVCAIMLYAVVYLH